MIEIAYADKGGSIVKSIDDMLDNSAYLKIVFGNENEILAFLTYSAYAGGKKLYVGAGKKTKAGKDAIQEIIKSDIEPYDNWVWGEVSGPIEHYFKKHNGRPIPKELVYKFLKTKRIITPSPDPNDPIHYSRKIANLPDAIEKALYGFKDEAMAKEVMESIDNYEEFRLSSNALPDKLNESKNLEYLEDALSIIIEISEFRDELGFNEMLPSWKKSLDLALAYLKKNNKLVKNSRKREQVDAAIARAHNLMTYMPVLELHKFVL